MEGARSEITLISEGAERVLRNKGKFNNKRVFAPRLGRFIFLIDVVNRNLFIKLPPRPRL
jgi:hypothetical protein